MTDNRKYCTTDILLCMVISATIGAIVAFIIIKNQYQQQYISSQYIDADWKPLDNLRYVVPVQPVQQTMQQQLTQAQPIPIIQPVQPVQSSPIQPVEIQQSTQPIQPTQSSPVQPSPVSYKNKQITHLAKDE